MKSRNLPKVVVFVLATMVTAHSALADVEWTVTHGTTKLAFDKTALAELGLDVEGLDRNGLAVPTSDVWLDIDARSTLALLESRNGLSDVSLGQIRHSGGLRIFSKRNDVALTDLAIALPDGIFGSSLVSTDAAGRRTGLVLSATKVGFDQDGEKVLFEGTQISITRELANALGDSSLAGESIGSFTIEAAMSWSGGELPDDIRLGGESAVVRGGSGGTVCGQSGVDVIVGDLLDVSNYSSLNGIEAFAVGTTSCNVGDQNLLWISNTNEHPVIGQNMFRLKDGRLEQIGQSWLKHGFTALTENICGCGCNGQGGSVLGVGCSDPYCCGLNGQQSGLGPRSEVNAHTGVFNYPFTHGDQGSTGDSTYKRLQVAISELDPAQDGGGTYFVEGHYVTQDDSAAGNQDNNASYRQVNVSGSGSSWSISLAASTQREQPGIRAWQDNDPAVVETDVRIPGEGLVILAAKATDLGGGIWHYEYAVQNLNSDRSIGSFTVPIDSSAIVTNIEFRDVDYHSGEPYSGLDWPGSKVGGNVTWSTETFATNSDANAIRWGTMYNFRFDANVAPQATNVTLGIFKPGSPNSVTAATTGPATGPQDCNSNGVEDSTDIANGDSPDCNNNNIPDECESFADVPMTTVEIASGLSTPVGVFGDPTDASRMFVIEQNSGQIKIIESGSVLGTPFLNISGLLSIGGERGLLGMAFHPDYGTNGHFFLNYTNTGGDTVIARYTVSGDPNVADAGSAVIIKTINQDFSNHNGGGIAFGPDGMLYVALGDGGSGDDPNNRAQDLGSLLGKMLRLDVDAGAPYIPVDNPFADEIWSYGLRNPWRFSFDRLTGDMYIADVGQDAREEINFEPASSTGGVNYGWDCREGLIPTPTNNGGYGCVATDPTLTDPIFDVLHSGDPDHPGFICSIIGGFVYRGCAMPALQGTYFYGDFCGNWIFSLRYDGSTISERVNRTAELGSINSPVAFGEDADGEMYVVSTGGSVYKIVPDTGVVCGNNLVETGEECDDGNTTPGDGCDENCQFEGVCGDGNVDGGEGCDDGNTTPGDGCDENCQVETADDCANAAPISDGVHQYSTVGATTDGPAHPGTCTTSDDGGQTYQDIWYEYTAECSGTLTISTCDTVNYDSDLVIYDNTDCGNLSFLACNDDATGCAGFSSILTAPVVAGSSYLIRVGGWNNGDQGSGTLSISNDGAPCTVCGDGVVEGNEECDPPDGVTCDANCQEIVCEDILFEDDFENGNAAGWNLASPGSTASTGDGVIGDPIGTSNGGDQAQPENAFAGSGCMFTAQNPGNSLGTDDVDSGVVYFESPTIDLSGETEADLTFVRWFYQRDIGDDAAGDFYVAEVSDNNGSSWVELESIDDQASANSWTTRSFDLESFISLTSTVKFRFGASDGGGEGDIVELAIDNVSVTTPCGLDADCNSNGIEDADEIAAGSAEDCNANNVPDECDIEGPTSSDCDGGPVGIPSEGQLILANTCAGCHGPTGMGGGQLPGPNIRNRPRDFIWNRLLPPTDHPGGAHPEYTQQDFANIEAFLSDTGSRGRPDRIPDECQVLDDCDGQNGSDGCDLDAELQDDFDFNGVPDDCEGCSTTFGDGDEDCDIDLADYMLMQQCYTGDVGTGTPVYATGCVCFDTDEDGDVDVDDYASYEAMVGPDGQIAGCQTP